MDAERWQKIESLYHSALQLEPSLRPAFLAEACNGDESLRHDVDSLLAQANESDGFLEERAIDVAAKTLASARTLSVTAIGRYRIVRLLGEGGMGAVYEAEQDQPRRSVALKVIRPGLATPEQLRRFQHESQALGRLQHPGIAQIYEASTADTGFGQQPYFAMELIRGPSLDRYAQIRQLNTREKLALLVKVCDAVQHAHQRGLIHRDLKPGNILVDETGQPKILDFGVARVSEGHATELTSVGQLVGTLAYMSPEQVSGDPLEVDIRSDVYSLGVILYLFLSGRLPYEVDRRKLPEAVQTIREEEPAPLSSIDRKYRGDIDTIVGKALEKDKTRRYASAADLAADIQRYLNDEPIAARPPSTGYQMRKFARRHRGLVAGTAAVFVVLLAGVTATTSQAIRATRAGQAALSDRDRATTAEGAAKQAERAATEERNRAVAAEAQAVQERNRALTEKGRADRESESAKAVSNFLQYDLLAQASANSQARPDTKPDPDLKVRTALDRAAAGIAGKFDQQPLVEASIRQTIGDTYRQLGVYPEAQKQIDRALQLKRQVLGGEHPDTLASMKSLAVLYRAQGKLPQAESLLIQVVGLQGRVLGESHPETLESVHELALVYYDRGKYPQAEPLLTKTLEAQRSVLGEKHPSTALTMSDLAELYKDEGKYAQAEPLQIRAVEIHRSVLGEEHPNTLLSMSTLAVLYKTEAKFAQAEPLFTKVLEVQRRALGESHPDTVSTMHSLADLYRIEARYGEAEALQTKVLEIWHRVLGDEHNETLSAMNNLAVLYQEQSKYAEAEPLLVKTLEIRRHVLGEDHPSTASAMNNLAVQYGEVGKFAQAETLMTGVLAIRRRVLGEEHPRTLITMSSLAVIYQMEGKYAQAEPLAAKALEVFRRLQGEEGDGTLACMKVQGMLYRSEGKYLQAEPLLIKVLEMNRRLLGQEHPTTLKSMTNLAKLYRSEGKSAEAAALLAPVLEVRRRTLGAVHPYTTDVMTLLGAVRLQQNKYAEAEALLSEARNNHERTASDSWGRYWNQSLLGASLAGQGQYAEAESLLVSGYQGMTHRESTIPFEDRIVLGQAGERIVRLYENGGKPEKAAEWRERLQK